jgi:hypothetical protein
MKKAGGQSRPFFRQRDWGSCLDKVFIFIFRCPDPGSIFLGVRGVRFSVGLTSHSYKKFLQNGNRRVRGQGGASEAAARLSGRRLTNPVFETARIELLTSTVHEM